MSEILKRIAVKLRSRAGSNEVAFRRGTKLVADFVQASCDHASQHAGGSCGQLDCDGRRKVAECSAALKDDYGLTVDDLVDLQDAIEATESGETYDIEQMLTAAKAC